MLFAIMPKATAVIKANPMQAFIIYFCNHFHTI